MKNKRNLNKVILLINESEDLLNKINFDRFHKSFYSTETRNEYFNNLKNIRKHKIEEALVILRDEEGLY